MPPTKPSTLLRLTRRANRHLCNLAIFALTLLLLCQCGLGWLLHNGTSLSLPEMGRQRVRDWLAGAGIKADFEEIRFSLGGHLEIDQLQIGPPDSPEPLLTARRAILDFGLLDLLQRKIEPHYLFVDDATVYAPATLAADGKRQPVLHDLRAEISREGEWLQARTLQAHFGSMPLVAHGRLLPPRDTTTRPAAAPAASAAPWRISRESWNELAAGVARLLQARTALEALGEPSLELACHGESSGKARLEIEAHGARFSLPGNATARDARLRLGILFDGKTLHPATPLELLVGGAQWEDPAGGGLSVQTGKLRLRCDLSTDWTLPAALRLTAADIRINDESLEYLNGRADWRDFPKIDVSATAVNGEDFLQITGRADWATRAADATFAARLTPQLLLEHPRIKPLLPAELETLAVPSRPEAHGTVRIEPGLRFAEARMRVTTGAAHFEQWRIQNGTGDIRLTPEKIELSNVELFAAHDRARLDFYSGFTPTSDFRFLITGSTQPAFLNPFLPDWWTMIWDNLQLHPEHPGLADIDIHGQWVDAPTIHVFCAAVGAAAKFRGHRLDHAELRIISTDDMVALYDIFAIQGDHRATGTLQWHYAPPEHRREHSVRFRFDGIFPKDLALDVAGIILPELSEVLGPLEVVSPAQASVTGYVHGEASPTPERVQIAVKATAPGLIRAWQVPLADFQGTIAYDTDQLAVTIEKAQLAGGFMSSRFSPEEKARELAKPKQLSSREQPGRLWVDLRAEKPVFHFDAELLNTRRSELTGVLAQLRDGLTESGPATPAEESAPATTTPPPDHSELDLRLAGSFSPARENPLRIDGHIYLHDPDLGRLHIFGGLSRVLDRIGLGVTSFKLEHAESDFLIRENILYVPEGVLTGPNSLVKTTGRYHLDDDRLNFQAILTVTAGSNIPILGHAINVVNRLPHLTPVNIHGTLEHPKWEIDPTPSALLKSSTLDRSLGQPPVEK